MKVGELVVYIEGGQEFNALVLGERSIADHLGKDDEPLLTLVFAKERTDAAGIPLPLHGTGQTNELVQVRLDVAHASHEYSDPQKKKYEKQSYDGGRWKEAATSSGFEALEAKLEDREAEIDDLSGKLAESEQALKQTVSSLSVATDEVTKFKAAALTHLARADEAEGKLLTRSLQSPAPSAPSDPSTSEPGV